MSDTRQIWHAALGELQLQVNAGNFDTFLRDTRGVAYEGREFVIAAPNPFIREALQSRFQGLIRRTLTQLLGDSPNLQFVVKGPDHSSAPASLGLAQDPGASQAPRYAGKYTFQTFVVGDSNRLAHAAAQAISDRPGHVYNPLFLYGGVGLGKTHLLRAMHHAVTQRNLSALYVSSETFTNDLIESIREHRTDEFRQKYRSIQVLLIDDIQFIATRERTQEEFFHTFNDIHAAGGQIVLSSDRAPQAISPLEARLRSRFVWGLIADVQPPDLETRIAILRSKLNGHAASVPNEVLEIVARKAPRNIRELEGALTRLLAHAQLHGEPLTPDLAASVINEILPDQRQSSVTTDTILHAVCQHFDTTLAALQSKQRDRKHVLPRHFAMYLLRAEAGLSLPEIGHLLGDRDHTTILHGYDKIRREIDIHQESSDHLQALRSLFLA